MSDLLEQAQALAKELKVPDAYPCAVCCEDIPVAEAVNTRITSWHIRCNAEFCEYDDLMSPDILDAAALQVYHLEKTNEPVVCSLADLPRSRRIHYRRHAKYILKAAFGARTVIRPIAPKPSA